jgi:hypothetical protein
LPESEESNSMKVFPIENLAEFLKHFAVARDNADQEVVDWQKEMKDGDHFVRFSGGLVIYGEIVPLTYEEDRELYRMPHMKNVRFSECYSYMCPEGEPGGIHVSSMTLPISREQFEAAKDAGWPTHLEKLYFLLNIVPGGES